MISDRPVVGNMFVCIVLGERKRSRAERDYSCSALQYRSPILDNCPPQLPADLSSEAPFVTLPSSRYR